MVDMADGTHIDVRLVPLERLRIPSLRLEWVRCYKPHSKLPSWKGSLQKMENLLYPQSTVSQFSKIIWVNLKWYKWYPKIVRANCDFAMPILPLDPTIYEINNIYDYKLH